MGAVKSPIAYVAPQAFFFVRKDIEALSVGREVHEHIFGATRPWHLSFAFLRQLLFLLRMRRMGIDQVMAHFAGYHTLLPILLGFRTHIIIAGADACTFPGIRYGSFRKAPMRMVLSYCMRRARTLLPVHASLARFTNTYSSLGPSEQGFISLTPGLATPWHAIPYGFDTTEWTDTDSSAHREGALCVAFGAHMGNDVHFRKGVDLILEAARKLPQTSFTLVGLKDPAEYATAAPNVRCLGVTSPKDLRLLLAQHAIYLQPSVMEGFPNALCEAMLMGCIPVVSDVTSMPDIVRDSGRIIKHRDAGLLYEAIKDILGSDETELKRLASEARSKVLGFTLASRISALTSIIDA